MEKHTHCIACGIWNSNDKNDEKEKQNQVKKYGGYLHNSCLENLKNITSGRIVTNTGIYHFGSPRIDNSNHSFKGFGGSKITVIYEDKVLETNNLFHSMTTKNKRVFNIIKKKINAILVWTWGLNESDIKEARKIMKKKWNQEWHNDICKTIRERNKKNA